MTDLALKKDFFGRFLSTTLQVRDIFGQARWEYTSAGVDYYSYSRFTRESPIVMLNVRMNLNNFKQKSRGQTGGGDGMDGGMGGEF